ncbi:hypothetical protein A4H97_30085 [Niastella yeongjuensis]|uniref:Secretion system C-terminal sorting domain-containing protein n=1 Tax=Niastella yeongjuensis TaxID=354355 RepID=A0A1V9EQC9_9BACT|nr:T9SS type A sorting domain-containing protein [Niastella yeongjuensis]OQP48085.1 hypothetical protein A4H97_30085 [Niastella yeongjuensis]SEO26117.1 Por secretion system C-terminal sorting domain-containing protein [Niastella yeongjuensis]
MLKNLPAFLLVACLAIFELVTAQDNVNETPNVKPMSISECPGWAGHGFCNLILNSQFTISGGTPANNNPFISPFLANWDASHGSPQLNIRVPEPLDYLPPGTNVASMWARGDAGGEGIVGNIPNASPGGLNIGEPYLLSFYRRVTSEPTIPSTHLDNFFIVLIKCADKTKFPGGSLTKTDIPALPAGSQVIYCETFMDISAIPGFQRIVVRFIPKDKYDLIWIFPRQIGSAGQAWLHVAFPQIFREKLVNGPFFEDDNLNWYLGYNGDFQNGFTALCDEVNTKAEWYGPANNLLWSATVRGSYYPNACPYTMPCSPYGPVPLASQTYTFKQTFLNAVTTSNNCSEFVTSRTSMPFELRMATSPQKPPVVVTENIIAKDAAFIRYDSYNHNVVVRAESVHDQPVTLFVYDMQGKIIKKYNSRAMQGTSNHILNLQQVSAGMYFASVQLGNNRYSYKFSVQ